MKRVFRDRMIAYKKDGKYLAVSLEFDILAEGDTIEKSIERLADATKGYLNVCYADNETDKEIYRKAPKKYQEMYKLFMDLMQKERKRETEKRSEERLVKRETQTLQRTYPSSLLCNA